MYIGVLSIRMYVYHALAWCLWRPEVVQQAPGLELQTLASCHVDSGAQVQAL